MAFLTGQRLTADLLNQNLQGATASLVADSATYTTTEVSLLTVTVPVVSGQSYGILMKVSVAVTSGTPTLASELSSVKIREDSLTGTQLANDILMISSVAGNGYPLSMYTEYTAVSTGNKTFAVTFQRIVGTLTHQIKAAATRPAFIRATPIVN